MYQRVVTAKQQKSFAQTWEYFCLKHDWHNDPYAPNGERYNVMLPKKSWIDRTKVIATIEFIPYDPQNPYSTVEGEGRESFTAYEEIMEHQGRTWEIDKLCIHEHYQRQGYFQEIVRIILSHATCHQPKYYIALIERKLYRMLRILFGIHIEQKGSSVKGVDTELVPMLFNIEALLQDERAVQAMLQ